MTILEGSYGHIGLGNRGSTVVLGDIHMIYFGAKVHFIKFLALLVKLLKNLSENQLECSEWGY